MPILGRYMSHGIVAGNSAIHIDMIIIDDRCEKSWEEAGHEDAFLDVHGGVGEVVDDFESADGEVGDADAEMSAGMLI